MLYKINAVQLYCNIVSEGYDDFKNQHAMPKTNVSLLFVFHWIESFEQGPEV